MRIVGMFSHRAYLPARSERVRRLPVGTKASNANNPLDGAEEQSVCVYFNDTQSRNGVKETWGRSEPPRLRYSVAGI